MDPRSDYEMGRVKCAILRFAHKYPLLGAVLASFTVCCDASVETMAVGMVGSLLYLYYAPDFVRAITLDQLIGVIHHEVRHVVFGHIFLDPADFADPRALTVAEEITVNENLPEDLPGTPILLSQFKGLPKNEDTLTRYARLAKAGALPPPAGAQGGTSTTKSGGNSSATAPNQNAPSSAAKKAGKAKANAANIAQAQAGHARWVQIRGQAPFAKAVIQSTAAAAAAQLPAVSDYDQIVIDEVVRACGSDPGAFKSTVGIYERAAKVNWRGILRQMVGKESAPMYSFATPPRRFPELLGVVPGFRHSASRPRIMVSLDTSESMSDQVLAEINTELRHLSHENDFIVVECDCKIHKTYRYSGVLKVVHGRGGTSFEPPLEPAFLGKWKPDLVIFFTDGDGPAPKEQPPLPIIWVLTSDMPPPVMWGKVIRMNPTFNA